MSLYKKKLLKIFFFFYRNYIHVVTSIDKQVLFSVNLYVKRLKFRKKIMKLYYLSPNKMENSTKLMYGFALVRVQQLWSPGPDAGRLHGVDEETPEASALQKVQCVDGSAPW